jgi:hypothetical protein
LRVSVEGVSGFVHERDVGAQDAVVQGRVVRVSRHEQHLHPGVLRGDPLGELSPAELGQHHVGQQHVDLRAVLLVDHEGLPGGRRLEDTIARVLEDQGDHGAHLILVFDEQNGLRATGVYARLAGARSPARLACAPRQVDTEGRPDVRLAVDPDGAAALLHDSEDSGEPEPRALARGLRGEERLEDASLGRLVDADARVAHGDHHVVSRHQAVVFGRERRVDLNVRRRDDELSALRHRVPGVHDQVHDDLLDLARIGLHESEIGRQPRLQLDVLAEEPRQHLAGVRDDLVEIEDLGLHHLAATEREDLPREVGGPPSGRPDLLEVGPPWRRRAHFEQEDVAVAEDHGEDVVEVVGDAPASSPTASSF